MQQIVHFERRKDEVELTVHRMQRHVVVDRGTQTKAMCTHQIGTTNEQATVCSLVISVDEIVN